jgi:hypothetical protein
MVPTGASGSIPAALLRRTLLGRSIELDTG